MIKLAPGTVMYSEDWLLQILDQSELDRIYMPPLTMKIILELGEFFQMGNSDEVIILIKKFLEYEDALFDQIWDSINKDNMGNMSTGEQ